MNSRFLIALVGALAISAGCTLLLGRKLSHRAPKKDATVKYASASEPIEAGAAVKAEQISYIEVPASQALEGAFLKSSDIVGRSTLYPIEKGQIILNKYLAAPGAGLGLTTKISDGMRAVALKSDDVVGVAGFLSPGSHVDVLVTYRSATNPEPITATVVQDAQVIAVNHQSQPDPQGKFVPVNVVTVLATPEDTQRLVLAGTQGSIYFVLRNGGDHVQSPDKHVQLAQLAGAAPKDSPALTPARKVTKTRPAGYQVEVILGDKSSSVNFN